MIDLLWLHARTLQCALDCVGAKVVCRALMAAGIGFEEGDDPQNPGVRLLVTEGDVALIFSVDPDETALPSGLFMLVCTRG